MRSRFQNPYNRIFHLTKPLVTHRAGARSAPNDFAGEANVRLVKELVPMMAWLCARLIKPMSKIDIAVMLVYSETTHQLWEARL